MLRVAQSLLAVGLVATLASGASPETLTGNYLEARTCDVYTGACFANSEFGLTGDQAVLAWQVTGGSYQGVDLSGLAVVAAVKAASTLGDEFTDPFPAKGVIYVDQRATAAQHQALVAFAKARAGRLLENVVTIETTSIEMAVKCCANKGCAKLVAGKVVTLETRCVKASDHICGHERVYYEPLTKLHDDYLPVVTVSHEFKGKGLNSNWSSPHKRSAFVGSFSL